MPSGCKFIKRPIELSVSDINYGLWKHSRANIKHVSSDTSDRVDSNSQAHSDLNKNAVFNHIVMDSLSGLFRVISTATEIVNYHNLMTYETNGLIATVRLLHKVKNNIAPTQLIFIDRPQRQVIHRQTLETCLNDNLIWGLWPTTLSKSLLSAYILNTSRVEPIADRGRLLLKFCLDISYASLMSTVSIKKTGFYRESLPTIKARLLDALKQSRLNSPVLILN